ncbi:MAG: hypothetical protein AB1792_06750 [Candidatus Zixiibacteriota bacterium]
MLFDIAMLHLTSPHWFVAVAVLVLALVAIFLYYRRTIPPLRWPIRGPLVALRVIAALALFLALAEVLWSAIRNDTQPGRLLVLWDRSASMRQTDGGATSRYGRAAEYIRSGVETQLGDRASVSILPFDSRLWEPEDRLPDSLGTATAIGDVLAAVRDRTSGSESARAVMVLSDGANNRGIDPSPAAAALGVPVITVGFGRPGAGQARIAELQAPDLVFTGRPFDVTVQIQDGSGGAGGTATIRLTSAGVTLAQQIVALPGTGQRIPIALKGQFEAPGLHDVHADVIGADGQAVPAAGRTILVRAMKGRLKVLLVAFELDWEYATLRRWLAKQARVELVEHTVGRPVTGQPFPPSADWAGIDVAIFLHPSRDELQSYWAPQIPAMSQSGKGIVFFLNDHFVDPAASPPPHPFEFCRVPLGKAHGEFLSEPVATRQSHPLVRLDPALDWEGTRQLWTQRPPWTGLLVFDTLPRDCDVLVRTVVSPASGRDVPVLWTRPIRRARSLTLAGSPMWRWVPQRAAEGLAPQEYDAFWSSALRWLTLADDADRLAVRTDLPVYHAGEPIELEGLVFDEAYRFLDRAEVTARVWHDTAGGTPFGDTVKVYLNPGSGDRFVGRLSALPPGNYRFDGTAQVEGTNLSLTGGMFRVEPYGLEQEFSALDERLLRAMARESGGRYYSESEAPTVLDSLDWTPIVQERSYEIPLGNHWLVLSIFIAALSIEWFIRRRRQLL